MKIQGDVPDAVGEVYGEWHDALTSVKRHNRLLLGACVLVAMKHPEDRDELFQLLAGADAAGQVPELVESLRLKLELDDAVAGRVGPETDKPQRKKKAARKKKSKGGNYKAK